ncbi:MAG TPA: uracil-DNA glycosylase, partial [Abditibacteriaceae bacterium]
ASVEERTRRMAMLGQPHIAPLVDYLACIKAEHPEKDLPCFDPCDGGIYARALFLFEAPGPKAVGSKFISRNNPDPTARNFCTLSQEAAINRRGTVCWNTVPWYVGDGTRIRAVEKEDIRQSFPYFKRLLELLPHLRVLVLCGKKAQSAKSEIRDLTSLPIIETHHPSARVLNVWPQKRDELREHLHQVAFYTNRD